MITDIKNFLAVFMVMLFIVLGFVIMNEAFGSTPNASDGLTIPGISMSMFLEKLAYACIGFIVMMGFMSASVKIFAPFIAPNQDQADLAANTIESTLLGQRPLTPGQYRLAATIQATTALRVAVSAIGSIILAIAL